ncbi:FAS-associated factor 2 isoform X1 [Sminthopsis crassicaudata]
MAAPEERDLTQEQTEKLLQFQVLRVREHTRCGGSAGERRVHPLCVGRWQHLSVSTHGDSPPPCSQLPSDFLAPFTDPTAPPGLAAAWSFASSWPGILDLTGIESMDQCRHTLEQHNWNIEGLLGWGYYLIMLPFRFTYYTILDIFRFALRFIRPDPRSRVTDPVGDIVSFMHIFEEKYGRTHPVFYQGTYSQALNDAKRELRFLLVYLHGDDHQDSDDFCRNTLCSPDVVSLINNRMLFWACSTNKPEGYRVSQALRENTYPFLAMIMLKDRRMTVVGRLEGLIQPDDLINQLTFIMDANQTYLVSERLEREERNQTQVLRQQQDEAYLASLRADQEKERKKQEERERKRQKEEEVQQQKMAEERRRRNLQEEKERKSECLPPEPPPDDPESVKIIFKLPNDSRVERRFHFTQSLTVIHDFLFSLKESPEKFQIEANFPRRVLPCLPSEEWPNPPTLQEAGLSHTEVLFVQDLTDD